MSKKIDMYKYNLYNSKGNMVFSYLQGPHRVGSVILVVASKPISGEGEFDPILIHAR